MSYLNLKPVELDALSAKKRAAFDWHGRILLPKYDGCFAMVGFLNGQPNFIMSRTGEHVKAMGHIHEDLVVKYPWIANLKGGVAVLGEAWRPGEEFATLSGEFRRQYPQPRLGFAPFDVVNYRYVAGADLPSLWSNDPYQDRLSLLTDARNVGVPIYTPQPLECANEEQAWSYAKHLKAVGGYDGAICSDPTAAYTPGSGKNGEFIKLKPLLSFALEVVGYEEDVGAKTGRPTGALVVRFRDGATCKVATGLSEAQQADLRWFVGRIIEVEAMGISSKGLLREPRYKGLRTDVKKADF